MCASGARGLTWSDVVPLAERVVFAAASRGVTLACAESLTGGMVAAALTSVAGSSAVFRGGVVSYDPAVKHDVLGVSQDVIDDPGVGVVSAACARAMAAGVARVCGAHVAVSTTGIAGPTGAEPGKPVGTVYVGVATGGPHDAVATACRHGFAGDREAVRLGAVRAALMALYEGIVNATL